LREVIQDHSVKPKLQCLMVDPSFSMVTVQSEDSGIVWETASSRCSTPWASETSSVSEGGSMEGSGAAGNITIIFDEEKVVRRRTRSGRSSRLSDRFSRPGSSRSASALGVERLEMMEVSQPNVKQDKTKTEPDLEEIKSMDQQLFSLISEGYEILNIRVPSKLPTVDEEESTELQDNLSYLDQTPKIKSRNHHQWTPVEGEDLQAAESQNEESKDTSPHPPSDSDLKPAADGPGDIDYFEKFTLLDVVTPDEQAAEEQDECITPVPPPEPEQTTKDTVKTISPSASEESFVFVSDEDIVGEHLDEVFYGEGPPADLVQQSEEEAKERMRRQSSVKESGSVLFESEETVLTPIYISSGPPKIIDPILLEEPTAMSFMYSDLYEDAMGERRRSDEEYSEAESVTSEKSYKRCLTDDCEEADSGYLEKFILKDETPNVEVSAEVVDDHKGGRMMWSQNEFEMSGCLTRVVEAEDTEETMKGDEIKETRPFEKSSESSISQVEHENKVLTSYQKEESVEKSKVTEFETSSESSISQVEHENNVSAPDQKDKIIEKSKVIEGKHTEIKKPPGESQSVEVVSEVEISEIPKQESVEQSTSEIHLPTEKMEITDEAATIDTPAPATDILQTAIQGDETQVSESIVDAVVEDTGLEIPKDSCLEVIADCEPPVQAHVEVIEKGEIDIQTQVCIDLQEVNLATTSTVDDLDQEGEIMTQDDAKIEPVEKPIEIVKQEDVSSEELVASEVKADVVKEMVNDSGELILLVPKGQAVEMDIEISPQPDMSPADQEVDQADNLELIAEVVTQPESEIVEELEEEHTECKDNSVADEEQTLMGDVEEETGVHSTLKRFTPLQDLSGLHAADVNLETANIEENALDLDHQMDISEDVQDVCMQDVTEDAEKKVSPDVSMEYEIITEQDTTEMAQAEMEDERVELVKENEYMEDVLEDTADTEELMEVDYETIDVEEEHQARLAAELEGLDWYCLSCGCLLPEQESGPHQSHDVTAVDKAYEEIMEKLSEWISELQGRSENIEDLVSELELAYNSVEEQFHKSETEMQAQNEEMMALESIDSAKGTLETTAREAETDARSPEDIHARLIVALDSAMSLELGPKGLLVFEDYAKGNTSSSQLAQRKGIAVPQRPTLQVQEPGSATSSSVTVYWKVNSEDVIDCFQVYCMEDPQGAISEEYRVTVKESYCVLEELEPDKSYKVWVMAVNYTGCSLPSARLIFKTAPSVPVIDTDRCTVTWDTAFLRWSSMQKTPELSYTLEYCRQYELEGEGLRTISGIKNFEHKVLLQPNENYLVYIKAVSEAGSSEQSEAALISTKGTKFHLQKATAHPALELSMDQTTLHYSQDTYDNMPDKACPSILGEQLPVRGRYYWENDVSRCTDYRLGVAYSSANINSPLGESQLSWCLQCTPTPSGYAKKFKLNITVCATIIIYVNVFFLHSCSYHLVHNDIHSSLFVIDLPERVGIFLDYQFGCLSFYNAQSGQLLGSFSEHFTQPCHPAVGMDAPGSVEVCMVQEVPEFAKDS
ncbi:hypothetical protein NL108_007953, partial [Boleophthalmus pectinirostris]